MGAQLAHEVPDVEETGSEGANRRGDDPHPKPFLRPLKEYPEHDDHLEDGGDFAQDARADGNFADGHLDDEQADEEQPTEPACGPSGPPPMAAHSRSPAAAGVNRVLSIGSGAPGARHGDTVPRSAGDDTDGVDAVHDAGGVRASGRRRRTCGDRRSRPTSSRRAAKR